jgi:hypothetical protein
VPGTKPQIPSHPVQIPVNILRYIELMHMCIFVSQRCTPYCIGAKWPLHVSALNYQVVNAFSLILTSVYTYISDLSWTQKLMKIILYPGYVYSLYLQRSVDSNNLIIVIRIEENIVHKLLPCCSCHNSPTWLSMQCIIPA